ncbi:DUF4393 domain-containing protein [Aliarcobacter cibarius]|uniref:DUF4393 domain-containing protein n=1 Tax=Aliarcobacter cibarius TaxID=255507 RepID=A0ABY2V1Y9_9BACT|nr:DUF4393 domain-containing protein [Aliarcobacter cibarius]TLS95524.1 DUF4393 domain-containing protein [Aliarcobacter cibarius]TLS96001.1 DUF4393 domain-containing protein [Aliarcobacter cibarius]
MSEIESPIKLDISESTNGILNALFLPATKQVGMALGNTLGLINTATLPFRFINVYSQENFKRYTDKIKYIPVEKIKEVEPEIGIPLIEKLSYTSNSDLAEAYANLLAKASNKDDVDLVHPGFINKINSMAPDEIKILEYLRDKDKICYIYFRAEDKNGNGANITYKLTGLENILNLAPKNIQMHMENLISLSILKDQEGTFLVDEDKYTNILEIYKDLKIEYENEVVNDKAYGENKNLEIKKSFYRVTTIGETFISACTCQSATKV